MTQTAQQRAMRKYRERQAKSGLVRFEVVAPAGDRDLIRALARQLSEAAPAEEAAELRRTIKDQVGQEAAGNGAALWAALRASPLVGAGLDFRRPRTTGRKIKL